MEIWHHIDSCIVQWYVSLCLAIGLLPLGLNQLWGSGLIWSVPTPPPTISYSGQWLFSMLFFNQVSKKRYGVLKQQYPRQLCVAHWVCGSGKVRVNISLSRPKRNNLNQSHWVVFCSVCIFVSCWVFLVLFMRKHYVTSPVSTECHLYFSFSQSKVIVVWLECEWGRRNVFICHPND